MSEKSEQPEKTDREVFAEEFTKEFTKEFNREVVKSILAGRYDVVENEDGTKTFWCY